MSVYGFLSSVLLTVAHVSLCQNPKHAGYVFPEAFIPEMHFSCALRKASKSFIQALRSTVLLSFITCFMTKPLYRSLCTAWPPTSFMRQLSGTFIHLSCTWSYWEAFTVFVSTVMTSPPCCLHFLCRMARNCDGALSRMEEPNRFFFLNFRTGFLEPSLPVTEESLSCLCAGCFDRFCRAFQSMASARKIFAFLTRAFASSSWDCFV